jgi:hypothetical protein
MCKHFHCKIVSPASTNNNSLINWQQWEGGPLLLANAEEGQRAIGHLMTESRSANNRSIARSMRPLHGAPNYANRLHNFVRTIAKSIT